MGLVIPHCGSDVAALSLPATGAFPIAGALSVSDGCLDRVGLLVGPRGGLGHASSIQAAARQSDRLQGGRDRPRVASPRYGVRCGPHTVIGDVWSEPIQKRW